MIVTSGGLGPTADDLTAEVVGEFSGPPDGPRRRARGADRRDPAPADGPLAAPRPGRRARGQPQAGRGPRGGDDPRARRAPRPGSSCRPPTGAAARPWSCCPGRRASCSRCGRRRCRPTRSRAALAGRGRVPLADHAAVRDPRVRDRRHAGRDRGRRASSSPRSRSPPACAAARSRSPPATSPTPTTSTPPSRSGVAERHADTIFSTRRLDDRRAGRRLLLGRGTTIATAESCTGGLLAARLTERAGSSAYVLGGLVVYSNEAKTALAGVDPALIERAGAVSVEVAEALADGARSRLGADDRGGDHRDRRTGRRDRGEAGGDRLRLRGRARASAADAPVQLPGGRGRRARPQRHRRDAPAAPAAARREGPRSAGERTAR